MLAVGNEELIKIRFHTYEPWKALEYCSSLGEIYDIVIQDMERQAKGLQEMSLAIYMDTMIAIHEKHEWTESAIKVLMIR